jgi:glutamine synthetase
MDMDPQPGYEMASWERGYGDFHLLPDLDTLRKVPWLEGTALVLCDVAWEDGTPVVASPRHVLKAQVERARAAGFDAMFGSELEFYLLKESYAEAHAKHYRELTPSVPYILDYHVLATTYDEPLLRQIRNGMHAADIPIESSKGEAWPGQQEINFRFADALTTADRHVIYKNGAKEIAHLNGCSITFMAKPDHTWIGNSCHLHASLWRDGNNAFAEEDGVFDGFLAGWIACARELALFLAPTINSYKRYAAGSWAPTSLAWGHDNRTCGFRIVGHGPSKRVETRIPGGDVNPYLAFAALIAAGLHGIEQELPLPPALEGNAYESDAERFPSSLREAVAALEAGTIARAALGDAVVDHYLNYGRTEQRLFDEVVTCYERERLFERG